MLVGYVLKLSEDFVMVGEAKDGAEGVELATRLQPDVVLLDLSMPGMDGLEALPLILAAVPGVRVVVLSAFTANAMAKRAVAAGAIGYIEKGLSPTELLIALQTLLDLEASGELTRPAEGGRASRR